jgi:hypothetical protein
VRLLGLLVFSVAAWAQPLLVYSDLARIDPSGTVTAPETPREILSPLVVRNGFTSFQLVVQAPAGKHWQLHIGQNPENAVSVTMYRESGDALERVDLPVDGDGSQVFWMDLWTAKSAAVQRIKVEPELKIDDDWVLYPMEGRVTDAVVQSEKPLEPIQPAIDALRYSVCYSGALLGLVSGHESTLAAMRSRNGQQDAFLVKSFSVSEYVKKTFGLCEGAPADDLKWYQRMSDYRPGDPESYLKVRDYLFRLR